MEFQGGRRRALRHIVAQRPSARRFPLLRKGKFFRDLGRTPVPQGTAAIPHYLARTSQHRPQIARLLNY